MKTSKFTLIELLVVIGIIGILIGILLPAISSSYREAKKTKTQAIIKQISFAIEAYTVEYGALPYTHPVSSSSIPDSTITFDDEIRQNLYGYYDNGDKIGRCMTFLDTTKELTSAWGKTIHIMLDTNYDRHLETPYGSAAGRSAIWTTDNNNGLIVSWE